MKKTFTFIFTLLLTASSWQLAAKRAHAQTIGLSVSPPILEMVIKPGKSVTQVFSVKNLSQSGTTVIARIVPFIPQGNSGQSLLKPNLQPDWLNYFSLANTANQLNKPFDLTPGQTVPLVLNITVPAGEPRTDRYATLLISTNLETENSKPQTPSSVINTSVGANILISISDTTAPNTLVKIENFAPNEKDYLFRYGDYFIADNLKPIRFTGIASNIGKYKTKTSGLIQVTKGTNVVSIQSLVPLNLLANSQRQLQGSPYGEILFQPTLTDIGNHLVTLDVRSENGSSHAQLTIVLLPFKAIMSILIVLTLIICIAKVAKKKK